MLAQALDALAPHDGKKLSSRLGSVKRAGWGEVVRRSSRRDDRTAVLLALAGPCHLLEVVAPERADRAAAKRRIAEASERVPAASAVKHVIDSVNAAMIAVVATTTVASSTS